MKSRLFATILSTAALATFTACGDDSNPSSASTGSSSENALASSSSIVENIQGISSSQGGIVTESSSSEAILSPAQSSSSTESASCINPTPVEFSMSEFNAIGDVYKGIQCNEKVVFMIRHAERDPAIGSTSPLTEDGFAAAVAAGQTMVGEGSFKYIYSGMVRTYQTALGIAGGRGEATYTAAYVTDSEGLDQYTITSPNFVADTLPELRDGWYVKDKDLQTAYQTADTTGYLKNINVMYAAWAYDSSYADVFYDLNDRSKELLSLIVHDYATMPKYTLVASHDQVLMPLTVWATNRQVDLKLHNTEPDTPRNWLNYLAGIAIIMSEDNSVRYVPIRGMASGVL